MFNSLSDVFDSIDNIRERIYSTVQELTREQAEFRPSPEAWSVANLVEHLGRTEERVIGLLNRLIAENKSLEPNLDGGGFQPFSLDEYIERAKDQRFTSPELAQPQEQLAIDAALAKIRQTRETLKAMRQRIESADLSRAAAPHPVFGPLNAYRWLAFIGLHEGRHLAQMKAVLASADCPARMVVDANENPYFSSGDIL